MQSTGRNRNAALLFRFDDTQHRHVSVLYFALRVIDPERGPSSLSLCHQGIIFSRCIRNVGYIISFPIDHQVISGCLVNLLLGDVFTFEIFLPQGCNTNHTFIRQNGIPCIMLRKFHHNAVPVGNESQYLGLLFQRVQFLYQISPVILIQFDGILLLPLRICQR